MNTKNYNLNWSDFFQIDEMSPSGLVRIRSKCGKSIQKCNVGHKQLRKNGKVMSWCIGFQKKRYSVHRIIWVLQNKTIDPKMVIDHLDGNPLNNKISNLSLKTTAGNQRNRRQNCNNTTGITGVRLKNRVSRSKDYWYYSAQWYELDGKLKNKDFSVNKLGEHTAKSLAISYREQQIIRLVSEGAEYTDRHGV